jgi:tetratricopeptide (TPR) repeat protein
MASRASREFLRRPWPALLLASYLAASCDLAAGGGTTAPAGPAKPQYEDAFHEIGDMPAQMVAQVTWAAQPIEDAATLGNEVAALKASLAVDSATFEAMCKVAFTDGKIEVGANTELQARKAEIEATLGKIKQVGVDLGGLPGRVKTAGKNLSQMVMQSPSLAMKAANDLKGQIAAASGDTKVKLEADLKAVTGLPGQIKTQAVELKNELTTLPQKAKDATTNLLAAFSGKAVAGGSATAGAASAPAAPAAPAPPAPAPPAPAPVAGQPEGVAPAEAGRPSGPPPPPSGPAPNTNRPPPSDQHKWARIEVLEGEAARAAGRGDHLTAADRFEEAYYLDSGRHILAFRIGQAAWKAKDCKRATEYLDHFSKVGTTEHARELNQTTDILRELRTFECPARTPEDEAAVAATLTEEATALGAEEDWGGAAAKYAAAYQRLPDDHSFAYHVAVASWNSHECGDAETYLRHFVQVGDPKRHRKELKDARRKIEQLEAGQCPAFGPGEKDRYARFLFMQAQDCEKALDYRDAVGKYERAYFLLPDNHAFAWRIADAAWRGFDCETAGNYARKFISVGTDPRYAADVAQAQRIVGKVDQHGCPNALWAADPGGAPAGAPSAGESGPPPSGEQGGAASCSVSPAPGAALGPWLVPLLFGCRRRRG